MNIELLGVTWAETYKWPIAVFLLLLAIVFLVFRFRLTMRMIRLLVGSSGGILLSRFSRPRFVLKMILLGLGVLFFSLALLRPQIKEQEKVVQQEGRDVLIALDISRSMLATDIKPNRLECAKKKIKKLIEALGSERVGLIVFSGSSFIMCPLTSDRNAFSLFLDQVDAQTIASGTTALDTALAKAIEVYERTPTKKTKLFIALTDGEDFSSNLAALKTRAQAQNMHIFTLGMATQQGAPIPLLDEQGTQQGHIKDEHDKVVISKLNDGILRSLAQDVGGMYMPVATDNEDIRQIVEWVSRFEKEQFDDVTLSLHEDQYHWLLFGSFFCFLLEWVL